MPRFRGQKRNTVVFDALELTADERDMVYGGVKKLTSNRQAAGIKRRKFPY